MASSGFHRRYSYARLARSHLVPHTAREITDAPRYVEAAMLIVVAFATILLIEF